MDVHLLVYDLSQGLARQMSMSLLGFQLDAIYHTSIELRGREYVYDGGIIDIQPGSSHLGKPRERLHLGQTNLPMDVIHDYLDSVRPIFTLEAYDLFKHNCNNFTDSFANFLLGKGIPHHISNMPQAVMDSPMGRMLLPQLTQGVNASRQNGSILGLDQSRGSSTQTFSPKNRSGAVQNLSRSSDISNALEAAKTTCAVIFFTSVTCPPCKTLYPLYDQLAGEFGEKVSFIKVDISQPQAAEISHRYSIRATPTFITFLKGKEESRWSGADPARLRGDVSLLVQMSSPIHPHQSLRLHTFANPDSKPIIYTKTPPLQKLLTKMGEEASSLRDVQDLVQFIKVREDSPQDAVLPSLGTFSKTIQSLMKSLPTEALFALVDLVRCALIDPRVSGYFAEEQNCQTVQSVLRLVNGNSECPYALRLVTIQMACNLFSTPLFGPTFAKTPDLRTSLTQLVSSSFLDDGHSNTRVATASLLLNIALANRHLRTNEAASELPEDNQVELGASVIEAIGQEEQSTEALHGMLLALGHLVYCTSLEGELADLLRALSAADTILGKKKTFPKESLIQEVGSELLEKGLRKP